MNVFKVIGKYTKTGDLKFISHLDVLRMMQRAVSRAGLPAKYSEGFNPHIKLTFGFPLSLGVESIGEYFELELLEKIEIENLVDLLNQALPEKVKVLGAKYYEGKESLMSMCKYSEYLIKFDFENLDFEALNNTADLITSSGVIFTREKKNKSNKTVIKELNTKEYIHFLKLSKIGEDQVRAEVVIKTSGDGSMKVSEVVKVLEENSNSKVIYFSAIKTESLDINSKPII